MGKNLNSSEFPNDYQNPFKADDGRAFRKDCAIKNLD